MRFGFIHDINGNRSSKRLIAFVAMDLIGVSVIAAATGGTVIPNYMFDGLKDIVLFGLGAVFGERMTNGGANVSKS